MASSISGRASNPKVYGRDRVTNGNALLGDIDGRTAWARRYRDLVGIHVADMAGPELITQRELDLVRHGVALDIELERMAAAWAEAGGSTPEALDVFQRSLNAIRRTWSTLGLARRSKDVTPDLQTYLRDSRRRG
jgi:hypothetical protein